MEGRNQNQRRAFSEQTESKHQINNMDVLETRQEFKKQNLTESPFLLEGKVNFDGEGTEAKQPSKTLKVLNI